MEPRTRARTLTAAAVLLTAGVTAATSLLPSSAHAAEPASGARSAVVQSTAAGTTVARIGAPMGHAR